MKTADLLFRASERAVYAVDGQPEVGIEVYRFGDRGQWPEVVTSTPEGVIQMRSVYSVEGDVICATRDESPDGSVETYVVSGNGFEGVPTLPAEIPEPGALPFVLTRAGTAIWQDSKGDHASGPFFQTSVLYQPAPGVYRWLQDYWERLRDKNGVAETHALRREYRFDSTGMTDFVDMLWGPDRLVKVATRIKP